MSDILIFGMKMPKGCKSCKLSSDGHCNATGQWLFSTDLLRSGFNWKTCRLPDCPLHELPEHGDLISAEDVKTVIDRFIGYLDEDMIFRIKYKLNQDCPVIVPSNREETE